MNLQGALARGLDAAKQQFNSVSDKQDQAVLTIQRLQDFAERYIVPALNASGSGSFASYCGARAHGNELFVNVVERGYPHRSAEFVVNQKTGDLSVAVNPASASSAGRYSRNALTSEQAYNALTEWAASANPNAADNLEIAVDRFAAVYG